MLAGSLFSQEGHRLLLAPLATRDWESPIPQNAENLQAGKEVYEANCARCHGLDGKSRLASNADLPVMPGWVTTEDLAAGHQPVELRQVRVSNA